MTSSESVDLDPRPVLLEVRDAVVHYGRIQALHGVSLVVREGELVTLLGTGNEAFADVLEACTVLVDGEAAPPDALVPADARVDVMPPFAGG